MTLILMIISAVVIYVVFFIYRYKQGVKAFGSEKAYRYLKACERYPECICYRVLQMYNFDPQLQERLLLHEAEAGNAECQSGLGKFYLDNPTFDEDSSKGVHWLLLAAGQQDADAFYYLGQLNLKPSKGEPDFSKAKEYFNHAVELGDVQSKYELANMLLLGQGGAKDVAEGERLYTEYAVDDSYIQCDLAELYIEGELLPKDFGKARHWLELAMADDDDYVKLKMAILLLKAPQGDVDLECARTLLLPLAEEGDTDAHFVLGKIYEEGLGVNQHLPMACMYYKLAAEDHNPEHIAARDRLSSGLSILEQHETQQLQDDFIAQHPISQESQTYLDYAKGLQLLTPDEHDRTYPQEAAQWLEKAAMQGDCCASIELHKLYLELGRPLDAALWIQVSIDSFPFSPETKWQLKGLKEQFSEPEKTLFEQRIKALRASLVKENPE